MFIILGLNRFLHLIIALPVIIALPGAFLLVFFRAC
jgi:hypothetical protein